ncbi:MAG: hypothetical protein Unbinned1606contig1000_33 [Prokaryotic dsDNA virus sp.]|nr:MAG: hypothetical protein Unbinned1606contig1000_33 [Prokaryotic dsDNA virus sp.]|tara:strand:+ start:11878 stop:12993 length:1116 start_codon:yes stop_codon:yes gene_type:complete
MSTDAPMPDNGQEIQQPQINTEAPPPPVSFEAAATQQPAPPTAAAGVREAFAARGYDVQNFQDDQQFIETIESGLSQLTDLPQLQQLAEYGRKYLSEQSQGEPVSEPPPESYTDVNQAPAGNWQPPEFDPAWDNLLTLDAASGQYIPVNEHVNPAVAQKANEYKDWMRDQGQQFWKNPYEFMQNGLQGWIENTIDSRVSQIEDRRKYSEEVDQFLNQNAASLYHLDEQGNIVHDPVTGEESLTPQGQALKNYAEQARSSGMRDPRAIQQYAVGMLERDSLLQHNVQLQQYQQQQQQQQYETQQPMTPEQVNQQQKESFVSRALPQGSGYAPNYDATVASAAEAGIPQNGESSFFDMAVPEMMNMGIMPQTG